MSVLITGGAGYIGSHCNKYFANQGIETIVLDNLLFGHPEAVTKGTLIIGDFGDSGLLDSIFQNKQIEAVIHFAALADVADSVSAPADYYDCNVVKMKVLLDQMVKYRVPYLIFSSSAATFGEPESIPMDESHAQNPINPYGTTKLIGEYMLSDYEAAYGIRYCAMRYFNAAGAAADGTLGESHDPEHHILPLIFQTALGRRPTFHVFGTDYHTPDGTCIRDYIHVDDLASAHFLAFSYLKKGGSSETFNLGNDKGYSVLEVIQAFQKISGIELNTVRSERRPGDPARLIASNKKAREILGWKPERSELEQIISDAWHWERQKYQPRKGQCINDS